MKSFINKLLLISVILLSASMGFAEGYYNGRNWLGVNDLQTISLTVANTIYGGQNSPNQTYRLWGLSCYSPACTKLIIHEARLGRAVAIADKDIVLEYLEYAKSQSIWSIYKFGHYQKIIDWINNIPDVMKLVAQQNLREHERTYFDRTFRSTVISSTRPFEDRSLSEIGHELREQFRDEYFEIDIKGATKLSSLICRSVF